MCEPVSLGLAIGGAVLSGGLQAYSSIASGKAASAEANYQAELSRQNAVTAAAYARDALDRGAIEEADYALEVADLKGRQRAALAANGVMLGTGSAARILEDTAMLGSVDAATIRSNAEREALGFLNERNQYLNQSALYRAQGKAAKRAGVLGAVAAGVETAANVGLSFAGSGLSGAARKPKVPKVAKYNPRAARYFRPSPVGAF